MPKMMMVNNYMKQMAKTKLINYGLKTIWIKQTKKTAQEKLNKHDWINLLEMQKKSTAIPSDVTTYRDSIRTR